ncbi:hypothetical protein Agabi119p4_1794 [Agaricus bisporus var. burnettii]|uniref:PHD-type domain-containing protein n=1 Tax=Agaricus bisporus var. burnettii TaxID=192524 RepID=A0A8H7KJN7_AGABI|nr:hypothetical protein Agabi119p4_1794 [Agaricus bisporus var. burnettii]
MSCNRCSQTHSTVQAFLLTCCVCNRKWHHRCHIPPVADSELILRIRAHNIGDSANGLQAWKCKRCVRSDAGAGSITPVPNLPPLPHSSTSSTRAPPRILNDVGQGGKDHDDAIIVIDDSDSDSSFPPDRSSSSKLGSSGSKRALAATHAQSPPIAKAINPNRGPSKPPPLVVRDSTSNFPYSSHDHSMKRPQPTSSSKQQLAEATDDDEVIIISPSQLQNKETRRNQFRRDAQDKEKNKRMEHMQRQQHLLKIKTEMKVDVKPLNATSQEPIQQPQTPEITSPARHVSVEAEGEETFVGLSAGKDPENVSHQEEVNLAPQWFHDDPNDIWSRALKIKTSPIPPSSTTRRKVQSKRLNEARPPIFSFHIMQWENQMKRVQR